MARYRKYHTRQKDAILDYLRAGGERYVTAGQIAVHLKENGQYVGLTTIYRHLEQFEREGIVRKIMLDGNSGACYQYIDGETGWLLLKCEGCGQISPMMCSHMQELYEHVLSEHRFQVDPHRTMFYGICDRCRGEEKLKDR